MNAPAATAFRAAVEGLDLDAAHELLAEDIVFHSPVTFHPFIGRETVGRLLAIVSETFEGFRYTDELEMDGGHALIFRASIDGRELEGIDLLRFDDDARGDDDEHAAEAVTVEITGLSLYTHHGVSEAEREVGQRLVLDLRLDVGETDATVTDSIEDTVDYAEVCQLVALIAQQRSHKTLERLCSTIANRLLADYELEGVWVKATKPEPPIPLSVDEVSVEVWREGDG